ncbi:DNA cytosine methyltransferase [Rhizobium ruizarguesonis]
MHFINDLTLYFNLRFNAVSQMHQLTRGLLPSYPASGDLHMDSESWVLQRAGVKIMMVDSQRLVQSCRAFISGHLPDVIGDQMGRQKYRFADLFAGCGGLSLGLLQAGMNGQFAIERDPMAFDTLSSNLLHGQHAGFDWPRWLDKRAWDIEELLEKHRLDLEGMSGKIDVLAGGPPCQGFSFAGRRMEDDPRNLMFRKYVDVVAALRPRMLVLENVPGMKVVHAPSNVVPMQKAPETAVGRVSFYDKLVESLDAAGYKMEAHLIDAATFGVPQRRTRLIAIGVRKDLLANVVGGIGRAFDLIEAARVAQLAELEISSGTSVSAAISDLQTAGASLEQCPDLGSSKFRQARYAGPMTAYQRLMHGDCNGEMDSMRLATHRPDIIDRFSRMLAECRRGARMGDEDRLKFGLRKHRIYIMEAADPAPTITTLPDDILHYSEPRILTVRESARLQSFPDWFKFSGKYTTGGDRRTKECPRYTQVGNAVPPLLARAIGVGVKAMLDELKGVVPAASKPKSLVAIA